MKRFGGIVFLLLIVCNIFSGCTEQEGIKSVAVVHEKGEPPPCITFEGVADYKELVRLLSVSEDETEAFLHQQDFVFSGITTSQEAEILVASMQTIPFPAFDGFTARRIIIETGELRIYYQNEEGIIIAFETGFSEPIFDVMTMQDDAIAVLTEEISCDAIDELYYKLYPEDSEVLYKTIMQGIPAEIWVCNATPEYALEVLKTMEVGTFAEIQ